MTSAWRWLPIANCLLLPILPSNAPTGTLGSGSWPTFRAAVGSGGLPPVPDQLISPLA